MTSRDFCYWLQGVFEVADPQVLTEKQVAMIRAHLNMVFFHEIDPSFGKDEAHQEGLNQIHQGGNPLNPHSNPLHVVPSTGEIIKC